jgi:peptidyl carrier protein
MLAAQSYENDRSRMTGTQAIDQVQQEVRALIEDGFLELQPDLRLAADDPLMESGALDSLEFIQLVYEVQEHFGIEVEDVEITPGNFGSIEAISAFVRRRSTP